MLCLSTTGHGSSRLQIQSGPRSSARNPFISEKFPLGIECIDNVVQLRHGGCQRLYFAVILVVVYHLIYLQQMSLVIQGISGQALCRVGGLWPVPACCAFGTVI